MVGRALGTMQGTSPVMAPVHTRATGTGERRWQLLGLGLPAALLMYFAHPRLALASLELLQGSAAVFYGQEEASADVEQKNSADGTEAGSSAIGEDAERERR